MSIFPKVNFDAQGYTAARAAKLDNLDATISSRLASIKSTQRGTMTISSPVSADSVTITAVNMAKTQLRYLGTISSSQLGIESMGRVVLGSSTSITCARGNANGATSTIAWELTEFN